MAVLPLIEAEDLPPEHRDIVKSGMNLHKTMVHSPETSRWSQRVGGYLRYDAALDPRLRELGILQVACIAGSEYEYAQHLRIGREFGMSDADLAAAAIETAGGDSGLEPLARLVMRAAREMTTGHAARPETMRELAAALSAEHLVDLIFTLAFYVGFGRLTGSFELEVEPNRRPLLDRFPMRAAG
nr:carboxymuconolactone decarboxylase family protein [Sphingomonas sp. Y57]